MGTAKARLPSARISAATDSSCACVRAATATSAPARASAIARPIPRPPPVTSARFPANTWSISVAPAVLLVPDQQFPPQRVHRDAQLLDRAAVVDHQRGVPAALLVGELRADSGFGLFGLEPALGLDALDHLVARGHHQPDLIEQRLPVRLDQDRRLD